MSRNLGVLASEHNVGKKWTQPNIFSSIINKIIMIYDTRDQEGMQRRVFGDLKVTPDVLRKMNTIVGNFIVFVHGNGIHRVECLCSFIVVVSRMSRN